MGRMSAIVDFWVFLKHRKKFWLFPVILLLLLIGVLVALTANSALAPFIYSLF